MTAPLDICTQLRNEATAPYVAQHAADVIEKMHEALTDVKSLARKMIIHTGTDAEFADIRLAKATAAIALAESRDGEKT